MDMYESSQSVVGTLSRRSEDELYGELALRTRGIAASPSVAGDLELSVTYSPDLMGPLDDLIAFGRRVAARTLPEAHSLMCGDADAEERDKIRVAFGIGPEAVGAAIAAALVAQFALAPAVAAVVAALAIRLFFRPLYEEMCTSWAERLPEAGG